MESSEQRVDRGLDPTERRIVGVLLEKELATPQHYPLTLNALRAGCNQRSNRDPVTDYRDFELEGALRSLYLKHWVTITTADGSRVKKWRHRAAETLGRGAEERAILAELLLRGPQQPGQLRSRAPRMAGTLDDLSRVQEVLDRLADRDPPLVVRLPRLPRERYERWAHTLLPEGEAPLAEAAPGEPATPPRERDIPASAPPPPPSPSPMLEDRVAALEARVADLEQRLSPDTDRPT